MIDSSFFKAAMSHSKRYEKDPDKPKKPGG